jgi:hypothetical protein
MVDESADVEPIRVVNAPVRVRRRHDGRALFGEDHRQVPSHIAEALNGDPSSGHGFVLLPQSLANTEGRSPRGRLYPS